MDVCLLQVYRCPVCKKKLTKKQYDKALGILKEQKVHEAHQRDELVKNLKRLNRMLRRHTNKE